MRLHTRAWRDHPRLEAVEAFRFEEVFAAFARLVIVAPHPDDEILGSGGLLAAAAAEGMPVLIIAVTDGEASHRGSLAVSTESLRRIRRTESECALVRLGMSSVNVRRFELPDSRLDANTRALDDLLGGELRPLDAIVAPWRFDQHCDHQQVARAARRSRAKGSTLFEAPVWIWACDPADCRIEWRDMIKIPMSARTFRAKQAALCAFASQRTRDPDVRDTPILSAEFLSNFERPYELLFRHDA